MENKNRQIIVGHANTFHDPAIAIIEGDNIFAEGIERHTQCKGGMDIVMLHYSWRAVLNAIKALRYISSKRCRHFSVKQLGFKTC